MNNGNDGLTLISQIVMLVTKAVSDQFGGGGISDRMIKFNGYPFLEKEDKEDGDHAYIEPSGPTSHWPLRVLIASSRQRDEEGHHSHERVGYAAPGDW